MFYIGMQIPEALGSDRIRTESFTKESLDFPRLSDIIKSALGLAAMPRSNLLAGGLPATFLFGVYNAGFKHSCR